MNTATSVRKNNFNFKWSKIFTSWYHPFIAYALILTLFFLLRLSGGNNPILLSAGPFQFRWYGVIITTGVVIASFLAQFLAEHRGDNPDHVWRILPVLLVSGIFMARVWYVVSTWESYKDYIFSVGNTTHAGVIEIWRGGIAIQGAVVGGIIGAWLYGFWARRSRNVTGPRFNLWRWTDYVAPGLVLAQAMGRWGNFMNNEAYGRQTSMPWGIKIPCEYRTTGLTPGTNDTRCPITDYVSGSPTSTLGKDTLFHPTFLYESLWDYLCFSVLFWMIMKPKTFERRFHFKLRDGDVFLTYWIIYSIGRFFTESLRTDSLYIGGSTDGLRTAQVTAIAGIVIASFVMFLRHRKPFPAQESLSVRLSAAVAVADAGSVASPASEEAVLDKPDYKARVRPEPATVDDEAEVVEGTAEVEVLAEEASGANVETDAISSIEPELEASPEVSAEAQPASESDKPQT
jgi:phosphatidylglycerol:prolipoprotein diacylglycerol transferase